MERIGAYVDQAQKNDIRIVECITDAKGEPVGFLLVFDARRDPEFRGGGDWFPSAAAARWGLLIPLGKARRPRHLRRRADLPFHPDLQPIGTLMNL